MVMEIKTAAAVPGSEPGQPDGGLAERYRKAVAYALELPLVGFWGLVEAPLGDWLGMSRLDAQKNARRIPASAFDLLEFERQRQTPPPAL